MTFIKALGILGGCFDPIHWGHLEIANQVRIRLALEKILFIPVGYPWLKGRELTPAYHRWRMLELALEGSQFFDLSRIEIDRPGPSYTVETLRLLRPLYPEATFYFILGWDALNTFSRWKEPQEIIKMTYLVAVPRPGEPEPKIKELEEAVPGISQRLIKLEMPLIYISSSQIRRQFREGLSTYNLVPPKVAEYIKEHQLYR